MKNLVNLVGFCSESFFLEFPSLKLLEIENCPLLKEFMHKPQSTDITTVIGSLEINKENDHHSGEQALFNAKVNNSPFFFSLIFCFFFFFFTSMVGINSF